MKRKLILSVTFLTLAALVLSACGTATPTEDPNAVITKIAITVQAQLTQIALLTPSATPTTETTATPTTIPMTATPSGPTLTPIPTVSGGSTTGDNSQFVGDVNIPDGTQFTAGTAFTKTWRFLNNGSTTWTKDYKLDYAGGNLMGKNSTLEVNLPGNIAPGQTLDISVNFVAPATNGSYSSNWSLYSANGAFFGEYCSIAVTVGATASTAVATATALTTVTPTTLAGTPTITITPTTP
jgi:hypothetical protein